MNDPKFTRRTVLATSAWGAPAVLVAVAAPAAAASVTAIKAQLEQKYGPEFHNTYGDFYDGFVQPIVTGSSESEPVSVIYVTVTLDDPAIAATLEFDQSNGWTIESDYSGGSFTIKWTSPGAGLVPNTGNYQTHWAGFRLVVSSAVKPASFTAIFTATNAITGVTGASLT